MRVHSEVGGNSGRWYQAHNDTPHGHLQLLCIDGPGAICVEQIEGFPVSSQKYTWSTVSDLDLHREMLQTTMCGRGPPLCTLHAHFVGQLPCDRLWVHQGGIDLILRSSLSHCEQPGISEADLISCFCSSVSPGGRPAFLSLRAAVTAFR